MAKRSRGNYTERQVNRCALMSGAFGREIDRLFGEAGLGDGNCDIYQKRLKSNVKDITKFVNEFAKDALLDYLPPRAHRGIGELDMASQIHRPRELGMKLRELSVAMDLWETLPQR